MEVPFIGGCGGFLKQTIIAVVLVGTASVLAHLYAVAQSYYPVVRVQTPEGLVVTAVHEPTSERGACAAANERFLAPFKSMCTDCRVIAARCERETADIGAQLLGAAAAAQHRVVAPGLQMAIDGPDAAVKLTCEEIARATRGQAHCLPPG